MENATGPLQVRVTAAGRDSSLFRMTELVAIAESGRDNYTSLADKAAAVYAPVVHILSAAAILSATARSRAARLPSAPWGLT